MRIALTLDRDADTSESSDYLKSLAEAGVPREAIEIVTPLSAAPHRPFDALLLGGGVDVDPVRYGHARLENGTVEVDAERDRIDFDLFREARRRGVPVFGICRGLQVVNVALGGSLVQDIPAGRPSDVVHHRTKEEKTRLDHAVAVAPGTRLAALAEASEVPRQQPSSPGDRDSRAGPRDLGHGPRRSGGGRRGGRRTVARGGPVAPGKPRARRGPALPPALRRVRAGRARGGGAPLTEFSRASRVVEPDSPQERFEGVSAMKIRAIVPVLALAAALLAAPLSAQPKLKVQKLADGVWAAEPDRGANVGWFLLGDGVVAVDAGADAATAREVLKQIAETTGGKPVRLLVLTHGHADHSGGARAFVAAGARVLCHEGIAGEILAFVTQAATDPSDPLSGKADARPVVESISERSIQLDGIHNVQIYYLGAAHTAADLVVYLAGDKILYSGDIAAVGRQPFMQSPDVDPAGWDRALQALARVPVEKVVPGHGEVGTGADIKNSFAYVHAVNTLAKKFVDNGTADTMIDGQLRDPENTIKNVSMTEAHVANVKASVKAMREKAAKKTTPAAAPAPTPAKK